MHPMAHLVTNLGARPSSSPHRHAFRYAVLPFAAATWRHGFFWCMFLTPSLSFGSVMIFSVGAAQRIVLILRMGGVARCSVAHIMTIGCGEHLLRAVARVRATHS